MYGAMLGDMIGAPYEFDRGKKSKNFEMFNDAVHFTDDTVMTVAVADALLHCTKDVSERKCKRALVHFLKKWGKKYPNAGYGSSFSAWLRSPLSKPYNSCGNGSAMRVSAVPYLFADTSLARVREVARWTAEITHDHPEGVKGAEATASAIWLALHGAGKTEIKAYIISKFGYNLSRTCDEIRPSYRHTELCQETVPEAITAFLEAEDFEDVIRTAVSLGGDCDTLTAIAASIGAAYYHIPDYFVTQCWKRLTPDIKKVVTRVAAKSPVSIV